MMQKILTTPLKNITGPCILYCIKKNHGKYREQELTPKPHIMENEVSEDLNQHYEETDMQFQLVQPKIQRRNYV